MPTIQVDLIDVRQKLDTSNVTFTAKLGDDIIVREIDTDDFASWEVFANWLINQKPEFIQLPDKEKSLSIEFHTEVVTDPETGEDATVRVLDNVTVL
jgi:hypothetical protein